MRRFLLLPALLLLSLHYAGAQTTQPYGIIDTADLKMTSCSFEKDANAMVLFDYGKVVCWKDEIKMQRHKRIKIFNAAGKDEANIRIEFYGAHQNEEITNIQAETINLIGSDGIEYTTVDPKLVYTEATDKNRRTIVFTFPNVKPGSVVEFEYTWSTGYSFDYPDWYFQSSLPSRYSEFRAGFDKVYKYDLDMMVHQPWAKDSTATDTKDNDFERVLALSNIQSYKQEPYMDYLRDYFERVIVKQRGFRPGWGQSSRDMLFDIDFGGQLRKSLANDDSLITRAKAIKDIDKRIAFVFDTVKKVMKWNQQDRWYTVDGVRAAWDKKTGNSTEINLVLYNQLKKAGINTSLFVLCTRDYGRLYPLSPNATNLNRTVVAYFLDSAKYYVLDATNRYNSYKNIPVDLMGLDVLDIDPINETFKIINIGAGPAKEIILINGQINTDGSIAGTAQVSSSAYNREKHLRQYHDLGEKKYVSQMQDDNQHLAVTELKLDNLENDTLPLIQSWKFEGKLVEPDGDYLLFTPNLFTDFETNPFLSDDRVSGIDFGYRYNYSINGRYTVPPGYKIDALPKPISLKMHDNSIVFQRVVADENGVVALHYTINYSRSAFAKEEYKGIHDFYKKMFELLNEQVVLKKI